MADKIEQEIIALQIKLNELKEEEKKIKLTKHYVSGNMEAGIIPFTNDVFQFICNKTENRTEYILCSVSHYFKISPNPIDEINNLLEKYLTPIDYISLYPEYLTQDVNYYNSYLIDKLSIPYFVAEACKNKYSEVMDILRTKDWEITYTPLGKSIRRFHRVFKIEFKNKYKIEPQVSFYVKPYTDMFQYKIVYMTLKYAIVEVSIIKENYIIDGEFNTVYYTEHEQKREVRKDQKHTLHWQVSGIIEETKQEPI